ncbi:MAG: GNAT family N-acetyltransferase [Clostridium sp.]
MIYHEDGKIKIRDIEQGDIISLFSCRIDKEINKYDPRPIPSNSKELIQECRIYCNNFERNVINDNKEDRMYKYFIITDSEENFIGFVNFFSIDTVEKQGEMGVTIGDKRYWRKGLAYNSINIAIEYIFNNMDINRIYVEIEENNKPSLALFNKLGFKKCDEYIEDEEFKFIVMDIKSYK